MSQDLVQQNMQASANDHCQRYLQKILDLTGALSATLFIDSVGPLSVDTQLAHLGNSAPLPELESFARSLITIARLDKSREPGKTGPGFFESEQTAGCILRFQIDDSVISRAPSDEMVEQDRRKPRPDKSAHDVNTVLIGLQFEGDELPDRLRNLRQPEQGAPIDDADWLSHVLILITDMLWEINQLSRLLRDPTSQLPGRAEFQARLKNTYHESTNNSETMGLLLVNPDEFGTINQRLDRESGDRALAEIALMLRESLRRSDEIFRYGGAVFAVLMPGADEKDVNTVAKKVRQALTGAYLDGAVRLSFSVGAVVYDSSTDEENVDELTLLRRADHALNLAKRSGGACMVQWSPENSDQQGMGQDRLSGIFTADTEKDYRNMLLLWDTIAVISAGAEEDKIAGEFITRVNTALKPERVGLIAGNCDETLRLLAVASGAGSEKVSKLDLDEPQEKLLASAQKAKRTERMRFAATESATGSEVPFLAYAVPLRAGEKHLGFLYLDGPQQDLSLDSSDLIFLNALASQVALALDRVYLAARWQEETERERRRLREEVQDLRQVVHSARVVYRSRPMQEVFDTLHAVAPTDVTILVTGESGTGKEMLARAIHEMGSRSDKPLVTVDCGAIAHNLLEAELFGHVKGAYTGADRTSEGRIVQADGGTIFLDEIGELPLDLQAKLLRFVQEKEINPVGATSSRLVDVRIVAATNRDLAAEVAAGRFREDLFYRLKVVTVTSPPLRERPDDIMPLAIHFLERFAVQYQKSVRHFSDEAEILILGYGWPGNVRELQNAILRAVVLSTGEELGTELLQFDESEGASIAVATPVPVTTIAETVSPMEAEIPGDAEISAPASSDPWQTLKTALGKQVEEALAQRGKTAFPLGKWLSEDLVLAADDHDKGVSRRACARLGLAETTYRRQLDKIRQAEQLGSLARTSAWATLPPILDQLVDILEARTETNVQEKTRNLLLEEVLNKAGGNATLGAQLMGVTVPTFRRWRG